MVRLCVLKIVLYRYKLYVFRRVSSQMCVLFQSGAWKEGGKSEEYRPMIIGSFCATFGLSAILSDVTSWQEVVVLTMALPGTHYTSGLTSFMLSKPFSCLNSCKCEPNNLDACQHPRWLEHKRGHILENQCNYLNDWLPVIKSMSTVAVSFFFSCIIHVEHDCCKIIKYYRRA